MCQEEQHGLLRLFGRGEAHCLRPISEGELGPMPEAGAGAGRDGDFGIIATFPSPDTSDISSPGDQWDQTGGLSPPAFVDLKGTPLRPNGELDLKPARVWSYVASDEQNMQNMHPLVIPKELHAMVQLFLNRLPTTPQKRGGPGIAKFIIILGCCPLNHRTKGARLRRMVNTQQ